MPVEPISITEIKVRQRSRNVAVFMLFAGVDHSSALLLQRLRPVAARGENGR